MKKRAAAITLFILPPGFPLHPLTHPHAGRLKTQKKRQLANRRDHNRSYTDQQYEVLFFNDLMASSLVFVKCIQTF